MNLEEVLPAYRKGEKVRRMIWGKGGDLSLWNALGRGDIDADDWEIVPKPSVEIDLVQYADGYEFDYGRQDWYLQIHKDNKFFHGRDFEYKTLGVVYMSMESAAELVKKLNSGEWVLK